MSHYFCQECGKVSEIPDICRTEGCSKKDQQLQECDCDNVSSHKLEKEISDEEDANGAGL